jgi:hypothetical protein
MLLLKALWEQNSNICVGVVMRVVKYRAPVRRGFIYYISSYDLKDYPIKIGFSQTVSGVHGRLKGCQTGNPHVLVLLGYHPGTMCSEKDLHEQFSKICVGGEWFKRHPELLRHINACVLADICTSHSEHTTCLDCGMDCKSALCYDCASRRIKPKVRPQNATQSPTGAC